MENVAAFLSGDFINIKVPNYPLGQADHIFVFFLEISFSSEWLQCNTSLHTLWWNLLSVICKLPSLFDICLWLLRPWRKWDLEVLFRGQADGCASGLFCQDGFHGKMSHKTGGILFLTFSSLSCILFSHLLGPQLWTACNDLIITGGCPAPWPGRRPRVCSDLSFAVTGYLPPLSCAHGTVLCGSLPQELCANLFTRVCASSSHVLQ